MWKHLMKNNSIQVLAKFAPLLHKRIWTLWESARFLSLCNVALWPLQALRCNTKNAQKLSEWPVQSRSCSVTNWTGAQWKQSIRLAHCTTCASFQATWRLATRTNWNTGRLPKRDYDSHTKRFKPCTDTTTTITTTTTTDSLEALPSCARNSIILTGHLLSVAEQVWWSVTRSFSEQRLDLMSSGMRFGLTFEAKNSIRD